MSHADLDDPGLLDALYPVFYDELKAVARRHLARERDAVTLRTTALVHEAYLRLEGQDKTNWSERPLFFAIASRAMRQILVDHARRNAALKRGGDRQRVPLEEHHAAESADDRMLALDEALSVLGASHPEMARVVECRFFGGLTTDETAEALGVSASTVERAWVRARAHLHLALADA